MWWRDPALRHRKIRFFKGKENCDPHQWTNACRSSRFLIIMIYVEIIIKALANNFLQSQASQHKWIITWNEDALPIKFYKDRIYFPFELHGNNIRILLMFLVGFRVQKKCNSKFHIFKRFDSVWSPHQFSFFFFSANLVI